MGLLDEIRAARQMHSRNCGLPRRPAGSRPEGRPIPALKAALDRAWEAADWPGEVAAGASRRPPSRPAADSRRRILRRAERRGGVPRRGRGDGRVRPCWSGPSRGAGVRVLRRGHRVRSRRPTREGVRGVGSPWCCLKLVKARFANAFSPAASGCSSACGCSRTISFSGWAYSLRAERFCHWAADSPRFRYRCRRRRGFLLVQHRPPLPARRRRGQAFVAEPVSGERPQVLGVVVGDGRADAGPRAHDVERVRLVRSLGRAERLEPRVLVSIGSELTRCRRSGAVRSIVMPTPSKLLRAFWTSLCVCEA